MNYSELLKDRKMIIAGAGLAGLLAANFFKRYNPLVIEAQESLPHNHEALLRFRTDAVSKVTGIPFKKVRVHKAIWTGTDPGLGLCTIPKFEYSNLYSYKVTGKIQSRSIDNLDPVDRFIAPPDFIAQMARGVDIEYSTPLNLAIINAMKIPIISTIPMPALISILNMPAPNEDFGFSGITSITCDIKHPEVDVYQTVYNPWPSHDEYRISVTGSHLIIEMIGDYSEMINTGIGMHSRIRKASQKIFPHYSSKISWENSKFKFQKFGKLITPNPSFGKQFLHNTTHKYNVYSLGRFATWRQLLMDDCVNDCEVIQRMILSNNYSR